VDGCYLSHCGSYPNDYAPIGKRILDAEVSDMPELPGHERREKRRARRHGRRLVRSGDEFTSDELERGEVELEEREPSGPEPEGGGYEPWGSDGSKEESEVDRERLRLYLEFIAAMEAGHGVDS
jgi:hypothetical protein